MKQHKSASDCYYKQLPFQYRYSTTTIKRRK